MGFFIKKINEEKALDFFIWAYTKILSEEEMERNKDKLRKLKEAFPLLKDVNQESFDENLTAVNIELLQAAWAKYYFSKGIGIIDAVQFNKKVDSEIESRFPLYKKLNGLIYSYNRAFASLNMEELFVSEIMGNSYKIAYEQQPEKIKEILANVSYMFAGTLDLAKQTIKEHKILS